MKRVSKVIGAAVAGILLCPALAAADEIRYRPINPAFGGSPLNSSYLLGTAEGQRPDRPNPRRDPLERFAETVQARLLDRVAQRISDAILGENAQDSGTFMVGDTRIDFNREPNGEVAIVVQSSDGRSVNLQIPVSALLVP